jgi:hypothetical protein
MLQCILPGALIAFVQPFVLPVAVLLCTNLRFAYCTAAVGWFDPASIADLRAFHR